MAQIVRNSNFEPEILEHFASLIANHPKTGFAQDLGRAFAIAVPWISYAYEDNNVELFQNKTTAVMHETYIAQTLCNAIPPNETDNRELAHAFLKGLQDAHIFQSAGMPYTNEKITAPQHNSAQEVISCTTKWIDEKYQAHMLTQE